MLTRKTGTRIGLLVLLSMAVMATRAQAQDTAATADSSDTYTTLDGYGLGRIVPGSLAAVTTRTKVAMLKMKIVEERGRSVGGWQQLRGKKGLLDVSIRLKSESPSTTRVEVNARTGPTAWDKGFEEQLLDEIGKR
jgi:hypothetical protein